MSSHGDPDKSYATHAMVLIAFTIALGVFAFWLVLHHEAVPDRVRTIQSERGGDVVDVGAG